MLRFRLWLLYIFQSTPSVGRATTICTTVRSCSMHFNPRPPWGGRPNPNVSLIFFAIISIHALRGEGDLAKTWDLSSALNFNPRPPWGGRHQYPAVLTDEVFISIHALRGEGDVCLQRLLPCQGISIHALRGEGDSSSAPYFFRCPFDFNPRPPWGGRRAHLDNVLVNVDFNPRPPWGGRQQMLSTPLFLIDFNPRPPWGGRPLYPKLNKRL